MKKQNFERWTALEMRACRREIINYCLHRIKFGKLRLSLKTIKFYVRHNEILEFGLELKRYYYYEYH